MTKFALLGYPIRESLSPRLFRAAYGGKWGYDLLESPDFKECLDAFLNGPYQAANVTMPFKKDAILAATDRTPEALACDAANILVKDGDGLRAYNSDFLAVQHLLRQAKGEVTVIGGGGAGRAALQAAGSIGLKTTLLHHDELERPVEADTVVYTLPREVQGLRNIKCRTLIEANYKTPCCAGLPGIENYIPGTEWLRWQAILGYKIMTGEEPDADAILKAI